MMTHRERVTFDECFPVTTCVHPWGERGYDCRLYDFYRMRNNMISILSLSVVQTALTSQLKIIRSYWLMSDMSLPAGFGHRGAEGESRMRKNT